MIEMTYPEFVEAREPSNLRLIDVREVHEFQAGRVRGAELFPLSRIQRGELPEPDERQIAFICRSGNRSGVAARVAEAAGFSECINILGGTLAALEHTPDQIEQG